MKKMSIQKVCFKNSLEIEINIIIHVHMFLKLPRLLTRIAPYNYYVNKVSLSIIKYL